MSGMPLRQDRKEGYWQPMLGHGTEHHDLERRDRSTVVAEESKELPDSRRDVCRHCGTEFVVRSPYCRMCGWRSENYEVQESHGVGKLDFQLLRRRLNLSAAGLICFIVGLGCLCAAATVGFIYSATTLVDWQAIQIWRVEWLLAAAVALLLGILLNRRG